MIGIIIALLVFAALNFLIALRAKPEDAADYHNMQRKVPTLGTAVATFTLLGGGEFVSVTALSYQFGAFATLFFCGVGLGFLIFAALVRPARRWAVQKDLHSLPDFYSVAFGRLPALVCSLMAFIALGSLLVIQFIVGGQLIGGFLGFPAWVVIVFMTIIIFLYLFPSGYKGVLSADMLQSIVMLAAVGILAIYLGLRDKAGLPPAEPHSALPLPDALGLVVLGLGAVLGGGDVWQRVLSAESDKAASRGVIINCVAWFVFGAFFIWLAMAIQRQLPQEDPNTAFVTFLSSSLPVSVAPLVALLVFGAVVSTAEVELFLLAVIVNKELGRNQARPMSIPTTQWIMFAVVIAAAAFAIVIKVPVAVYFTLLYILSALGTVTLARLLGRGNGFTAILGMIGGLDVIIALYSTGKLSGWYPFLIVAPGLLAYFVKAREPKEQPA